MLAQSAQIQTSKNKGSYLLDLLVDNDADSMLGYIVDASCLAVVAFMRHTFLNGSCALKQNHNSFISCISTNHLSNSFSWGVAAQHVMLLFKLGLI